MPRVAVVICLFTAGLFMSSALFMRSAQAVVYGNLELRWQTNDYDSCGAYTEQRIDLGYRFGDQLSGGILGSLREGDCRQHQLQHFFLQRRLSTPMPMSIKLGRFERIDAAGYYHLDGLQLSAYQDSAEWQFFAGKPQRLTFYAAPEYRLSADERLAGTRLIGVHTRYQMPDWQRAEEDLSRLGMGVRHFWGDGERQTRLDSDFQGRWQYPWTGVEQLDLNAALSIGLDHTELISFDWLSRLYLSKKCFVSLRGMTFDPPDEAVDFRERYVRFYAQGRQTHWSLQGQDALHQRLTAGVRFKHILREVGPNGFSAELYGRLRSTWGWQFEGLVGLLDVGDERRRQLYLEGEKILSAKSVLILRGSLIGEDSLLAANKRVAAVELSMDWMLQRGLTLQLAAERAWIDYRDYGDQNRDYRFALRLKYALPASGAEDYR